MVFRFWINSLNGIGSADFNRVRTRENRYHRKNSTELICGYHRETPLGNSFGNSLPGKITGTG